MTFTDSVLEKMEISQGDITLQRTDAIVNAANESLLGGGGVDGAIHRAAGPSLLEECRTIGGCPTGEARLTKGYNLTARFVIHTVGPIWRGGDQNESELLASCYRSVLKLTADNQISSISFPSISTGVYGFPLQKACRIALNEVGTYLANSVRITKAVFVCFSPQDEDIYRKAFVELSET